MLLIAIITKFSIIYWYCDEVKTIIRVSKWQVLDPFAPHFTTNWFIVKFKRPVSDLLNDAINLNTSKGCRSKVSQENHKTSRRECTHCDHVAEEHTNFILIWWLNWLQAQTWWSLQYCLAFDSNFSNSACIQLYRLKCTTQEALPSEQRTAQCFDNVRLHFTKKCDINILGKAENSTHWCFLAICNHSRMLPISSSPP